jgi:glycosyltransferase involved in cell wall biosynthesis
VRLAVFTNQFPGPVCTFFARDMRGLIDAGAEIDVFPIYPLDPVQWRYVPDILNETVLPRIKVHHLDFGDCFRSVPKLLTGGKGLRFVRDALTISGAVIREGIEPSVKTFYVFGKALRWVEQYGDKFDHVLGYWGNYAGTCAYMFHRLVGRSIPFSLFLHAGTDLYRTPVFLRQKLVYADKIITCSDFNERFIGDTFADVAEYVSKKIYVHHHGLDFAEFAFDLEGRFPRKIIAVGRIEREKGFEYLMRAVSRLRQRGVDIEAELVGDGSCAAYLKSLCSELGIVDRVRFRGWLTPDETRTAMKNAAILVHPSPALGDGVPNVIKECMALGTPVIGTAVAGIPEILEQGKHGCLVPAKDVEALAAAMLKLLDDAERRVEYAYSARNYAVKRFDLWRNGEELLRVLRSATRPARPL